MNRRARPGARAALGAVVFVMSMTAGLSSTADAATASSVRWSLDGCVPMSVGDVDALLALELDASNPGTPPEQGGAAQITVECVDEEHVRLTVDRAGARRQQRILRLYDVPSDARPRLLALSIVELIVSSGDVAGSGEVPPAPVAAGITDAPPPPPRWRIDGGGSMRAFTRNWAQPMLGGAAGVTRTWPGTHHAASLHVAVETSDQAASLGRVRVLVASAALCYQLLGEYGRWRYGLAPGLRLGWARLAGAQAAADVRTASFGRGWTGPVLAARLDAALGAHAFAGAGLEVGKPLHSVRGVVDGHTEVELGGVWISAVIAVGLRL